MPAVQTPSNPPDLRPVPELTEEFLRNCLNPEQLEAVLHAPGAQLILAGAGSGKTRVLTYKIAWLLREHGYRAHEILAVTFTNKAAHEMRARVGQLLGYEAPLKWMGTFHSICARLLRFHAARLEYTSNFTIFDVDDQKRVVKKLIVAEGLENDVRFSVEAIRNYVGRCKNQGMGPEDAAQQTSDRYEERMASLYRKYQDLLRQQDAMDFDDLIFLAIKLLNGFPEIQRVFSSSFRYILIDEYQDTNKAQYQLIHLFLGSHRNMVAVGDDDQSIYGWRGADIANILKFREDFSEAKITKLEQNYRSTSNILGVAASVIKNNRGRMDKTLWTKNPPGEKVVLIEVEDDMMEAAWVARRIQNDERFRPGETAVFYRTNAQSRVLEDELRRRQIPYLIVGGIRFYARKEVKDLIAYLRLLVNPKDDVSFIRAVNIPKRGIGDRSLEQLQEFASQRGLALSEALAFVGEIGLGSAATNKMRDFYELIQGLRASNQSKPLPELVAEVLTRSGYKAFLEADKTDDALDRLANVEELVSAAQDFLDREEERNKEQVEVIGNENEPGLNGDDYPEISIDNSPLVVFLQEISLLADADTLKANQEAVTLMTVHSAKGLEFPRVFVTGLEEGLFPMVRDAEDDTEVEEERRLFYVATTRARQDLYLIYARRRRRYGNFMDCVGSRFLREIDKKYLEVTNNYSSRQAHQTSRPAHETSRGPNPPSRMGSLGASEPDPMPRYEDVNQDVQEFRVGQNVRHNRFGMGKVVRMEGSGESARVDVTFSDHIRRTLLMKFAKLEIMD